MNPRESLVWPAVAERPRRTARLRAWLTTLNWPLVAILVVGSAFSIYYTTQISDWLVMTDELLYVKLAQNVGQTLSPIPEVHGHYFAVFNQLYPILMAPVFALFDMPTAFRVAHVYNAVIMASAAIPAFLLAREVVGSRLAAYLVAALTVSVPWIVMSTMMLTEVAAYPAFIWAVLAMQRAVSVASPYRDAVAIGGIFLAFIARTQFLLLAIALPLVIVIHELSLALQRRQGASARTAIVSGLRRSASEHRMLVALTGFAALVAAAVASAGSLGKALGNYETAAHSGGLLPDGILRSAAVHLDFAVVAVGVLPFILAVAWALGTLLRPSTKAGHSFAVILLVLVPAFALEVSSFDLRFAFGGIQDRYLFYIVPLLFIGMAACLLDARKPSYSVLVVGVGFAAMATLAQYSPSPGPYFSSPASAFHVVLDGRAWRLGQFFSIDDLQPRIAIAAISVVLSVISVLVIRFLSKKAALLSVGLAVLAFCMVETRYVFDRMLMPSEGHVVSGASVEGRDWIDETVDRKSSVGLIPSPINYVIDARGNLVFTPHFDQIWWSAEFWNKSVDHSYSYSGDTTFTPFPAGEIVIQPETGAAHFSERSDYLVTASGDIRFGLDSTIIDSDRVGLPSPGLELVKPVVPYRVRWLTSGLDIDGWTRRGTPARVRVYGTAGRLAGRRLSVTIASTVDIERRRSFEIRRAGRRVASGVVAPGALPQRTIPLCVGRRGFSDLTIDVRGSTVFSGRSVGLRVVRIAVSPQPAVCGQET